MNNELTQFWQRFYEEKAASLLLYGRALGLSHCEAEDVLQETFIALLKKTEMPSEPEFYCLRSYRNRAVNYKRSLWRRLTRELEAQRWFERGDGESPFEREAMNCLVKLPADQREVIVLKIWHEYTFEKIGDILGLSPNTAAGRYRYGLAKLKSCLKGKNNEQLRSMGESIAFMETAASLPDA